MKRCLSLSALCLLLLNGCVGYKLGSMLPDDVQTVHVPSFKNNTERALIEMDATRATIRQIQRDGSLRIAEASTADAILEVTLTEYRLDPIAYGTDRATTAEEYRQTIRAKIVLRRVSNGEVLVEDPTVYGDSTFLVSGDFTSSQDAALPKTADDLGYRIVERIVEAWR